MAKVMISLPDKLLDELDRRAQLKGSSRSALLREAVSKHIDLPDPDQFDRKMEELRTMLGREQTRDLWSDIKEGRRQRASKAIS